jgi:hypothetical protein
MACSDEDRGRSRRPGAEDRGWSHRSGTRWPGDREVGWHRVRSAPGTWRLEAWWRVFRFGPQNRHLWFGDLGLKITVTISWFGPQNQVASVCRLRHKTVEASLARVFQSGLKTGGGATTGGARGTIAEVASEAS